MFIKNIHVSLFSINLCRPRKKCIWKRICQIHQIRWIKYKYKYKYMVWNLIKYKYKYKYAVFVFVFANTNTYLTPALLKTYCYALLWFQNIMFSALFPLTHSGRATHICISKLTIIGSHNGLSPGWRQAIMWTNAGLLSIGILGTNLSEILIEIQRSSLKKTHLKMLSEKWRPFCLGLNVLTLCMVCVCVHCALDSVF